jgi:hypothetical protein
MSTSLPSAKALMTHADDSRHIVYATWVVPKFFPYMRDLLCVLYLNAMCHPESCFVLTPSRSNELTKQHVQEKLARDFMNAIAQPSNIDCHCLTITGKLRIAFKLYGEGTEMLADENCAWNAATVAMIYFILVTDFQFAAPMSNQMKANHLEQLRILAFAGPRLPARFLQ